MNEAQERVANGVALLDEHRPGWDRDVDLDNFKLSSCDECVLGQLYGRYGVGIAALGLKTGINHGFAAPHGFFALPGFGYEDLEGIWVDEIVARRSREGAPADDWVKACTA